MAGKFVIMKKGYDTQEVDRYVEGLELTIKAYKEKDDAIKNALINAQIVADNVKKTAEKDVLKIKSDLIEKLDDVSRSVATQKKLVDNFKEEYGRLVKKYLHDFNELEISVLYSKITELEDYINVLKSDERVEALKEELGGGSGVEPKEDEQAKTSTEL